MSGPEGFDDVFRDQRGSQDDPTRVIPTAGQPYSGAEETRIDAGRVPPSPPPPPPPPPPLGYPGSTPGYGPAPGAYAGNVPPWGPAQPPLPPGYRPPPLPPPSLTTTVLITIFFGPFGLIPASSHTQRARAMGIVTNRYWKAFWITTAVQWAISLLSMLVMVLIYGSLLAAFVALSATVGSNGGSYPQTQSTYYSQPTYRPTSTYTQPTYTQPTEQPTYESTYDEPAEDPDTGDDFSFSSGEWILVLDSFDKAASTDATPARQVADQLESAYGVDLYIIDSDEYSGLNAGYWAVVMGPYGSDEEARADCTRVGRSPGDNCYGRQA